jgi:restriction system protein
MKNKKMWMVRAGESAKWIEDFAEHQVVAIGWHELGEVKVGESREAITERAKQQWPGHSKSKLASGVGQIFRFLNEFKKGDGVVSYDPSRRVYLVGTIEGDPEYKPELFEQLPRVRAVQWKDEVPRDKLSVSTRNSLGAISTLFQLPPEAADADFARRVRSREGHHRFAGWLRLRAAAYRRGGQTSAQHGHGVAGASQLPRRSPQR